jgi:hypothetical protein
VIKRKNTYSKEFSDLTLAFGLTKRMNGFHFCYTGNQELVRLGFMMSNDPGVKPYITAKGKKFLMEVLQPLAESYQEDKPKEDTAKKAKVDELVKNMKDKPQRAYFEPQLDDEDDEDEDDEVVFKKKEKPENDSQA